MTRAQPGKGKLEQIHCSGIDKFVGTEYYSVPTKAVYNGELNMENLVGKTLGQYQLVEIIHQGENTVYKGESIIRHLLPKRQHRNYRFHPPKRRIQTADR